MQQAKKGRAAEEFSNSPDANVRRWTALLIGSLAFGTGLIMTAGWTLRVPAVVLPNPSLGGMVLMTSICVLMVGAGLLVSVWRDAPLAARIQRWLGMAIFLIAAITVAEMICGRNLGLDSPELHAALLPDYPAPGRMAPNTTLGFLLIGLVLMVPERRRLNTSIRVLLVTVFLIGAVGFCGFWLKLQYFYEWYTLLGMSRMALTTSIVLMLLPLGLRSTACVGSVPEHRDKDEGQELRGIFNASAIVLLLTAAATAISSFAFMQDQIFHLTSAKLSELAHNDGTLIEQAVEHATEEALSAANAPSLSRAMRAWNVASSSTAAEGDTAPAALRELGEALLTHGFSGVVFRGLKHQTLQMGTMVVHPGFSLPLRDAVSGTLLWEHGYYVSTTFSIRDSTGVIGEMLAQQSIPVIDRLAKESETWGKTSTMILCTQSQDHLDCLPQRFSAAPFTVQLAKAVAAPDAAAATPQDHARHWRDFFHVATALHARHAPLPMSLALAGKTGTTVTLDYRSVPVMASYTPTRNAALGLVLKMDVTELYEPLRRGIEIMIPLIGLLILGSLRIMKWRLKPLVETLVHSREQIRQLALHDSLTGLPNRILFEDRLKMTLFNAKRSGKPFALALLDVDGFKEVNDNLGHQSGDLLLQIISKRLTECVRASDTVARIGGDEFVLILLNALSDEAVVEVANKILCAFSPPAELGACRHSIRLSIGIALYPIAGEDMETLIHHADSAMYGAKQSGGNRHRIFRPFTENTERVVHSARRSFPASAEIISRS